VPLRVTHWHPCLLSVIPPKNWESPFVIVLLDHIFSFAININLMSPLVIRKKLRSWENNQVKNRKEKRGTFEQKDSRKNMHCKIEEDAYFLIWIRFIIFLYIALFLRECKNIYLLNLKLNVQEWVLSLLVLAIFHWYIGIFFNF